MLKRRAPHPISAPSAPLRPYSLRLILLASLVFGRNVVDVDVDGNVDFDAVASRVVVEPVGTPVHIRPGCVGIRATQASGRDAEGFDAVVSHHHDKP